MKTSLQHQAYSKVQNSNGQMLCFPCPTLGMQKLDTGPTNRKKNRRRWRYLYRLILPKGHQRRYTSVQETKRTEYKAKFFVSSFTSNNYIIFDRQPSEGYSVRTTRWLTRSLLERSFFLRKTLDAWTLYINCSYFLNQLSILNEISQLFVNNLILFNCKYRQIRYYTLGPSTAKHLSVQEPMVSSEGSLVKFDTGILQIRNIFFSF